MVVLSFRTNLFIQIQSIQLQSIQGREGWDRTVRAQLCAAQLQVAAPEEDLEGETPTFVGEVDEFDAPLATRRPVTRRPAVASRRPAVVRKRPRKPVGSRNNFNSIDDDCSNPFKCPPTRVADGRKPRVKSDIKARKRNYHNPWKSRQPKRQRV